ncbi:hypothetical protein DPMN_014060 [Dreissena polymorpha]|uniref:Uncharacterized protein n=1 Tax=Dreissena polymorpha TaxID=45954 RepID=A0A9D4S4B5_DREPO|nr:hypothetical protein DPMN_014060 [Dreissena polymorpha]
MTKWDFNIDALPMLSSMPADNIDCCSHHKCLNDFRTKGEINTRTGESVIGPTGRE